MTSDTDAIRLCAVAERRETWTQLCNRTRGLCLAAFNHSMKYELPYDQGLDMDAIYRSPWFKERAKAQAAKVSNSTKEN